MALVLAFGPVLPISVSLSGPAARTVLCTAIDVPVAKALSVAPPDDLPAGRPAGCGGRGR